METVTMYKTSDGRTFEKISEAESHEKEITRNAKIEALVYRSDLMYNHSIRDKTVEFLIDNWETIYNILNENH